jgi:DNA-binding transcriptional LysR family regulator
MSARAPHQKLAVLASVVKLGSFSKAARELGISTSAISQTVRSLEQHVGVPLLVRSATQIRPTEVGRELVTRTSAALKEIDLALAEAANEATRLSGRLRFTAPRVALDSIVRPALLELRERQPNLQVEVVVDDKLSDLIAEDLDFGIRLDETVPKDFVAVRLSAAFRLVIAGAPSYLEQRGRPRHPRDLEKHECLGFRFPSSGSVYVWELERGRKQYRIPPRGNLVTNDSLLMVNAACDGHGLVCVLEPSVSAQVAARELEIVLEPWAPLLNGFFACFPRQSRRSAKVRAFLDAVRRK